jgi:hypothetical protein
VHVGVTLRFELAPDAGGQLSLVRQDTGGMPGFSAG